jgi:hypothetical protein
VCVCVLPIWETQTVKDNLSPTQLAVSEWGAVFTGSFSTSLLLALLLALLART